MKKKCKHRWHAQGYTLGVTTTSLEECSRCGAKRDRVLSPSECLALKRVHREEVERCYLLHKVWHKVSKILDDYTGVIDQGAKLKLYTRLERMERRYPNDISSVRVDDDYFATSYLFFVKHQLDDPKYGRSFMGTSVIYIPQVSPNPFQVFFLYPQHVDSVLEILVGLQTAAKIKETNQSSLDRILKEARRKK